MSNHCSWIITYLATGEVFEVFGKKPEPTPFVRVEAAAEYLGRINREIGEKDND